MPQPSSASLARSANRTRAPRAPGATKASSAGRIVNRIALRVKRASWFDSSSSHVSPTALAYSRSSALQNVSSGLQIPGLRKAAMPEMPWSPAPRTALCSTVSAWSSA